MLHGSRVRCLPMATVLQGAAEIALFLAGATLPRGALNWNSREHQWKWSLFGEGVHPLEKDHSLEMSILLKHQYQWVSVVQSDPFHDPAWRPLNWTEDYLSQPLCLDCTTWSYPNTGRREGKKHGWEDMMKSPQIINPSQWIVIINLKFNHFLIQRMNARIKVSNNEKSVWNPKFC